KLDVFRRVFELRVGNERYQLVPRFPMSTSFELRKDGELLGTIRRSNFFSRQMDIDLPEEFPVAVRVFIIWIALLMLRRLMRNNGGN
ncbi:MAG: hypothetical protein ACI9F9_002588, partial [Candidatus Paceibacteria bacterium]